MRTSTIFKNSSSTVGTLISESAEAIDRKQASVDPAALGAVTDQGINFRSFSDGSTIAYNARLNRAFHIHGAIAATWRSLGGLAWGMPESDELVSENAVGRWTRFDNGKVIIWSPQAGAWPIMGAIAAHWASIGGSSSYLGFPIRGEQELPEGGRVSVFEHGSILWWEDLGALDLSALTVRLVGLRCYGETDEDQLSGSDEPVVVMGYRSGDRAYSATSPVFQDVDGGDKIKCDVELYRGPPAGGVMTAALFEHDMGDPKVYEERLKTALLAIHNVGVVALNFIPIVGWAAAAIAKPIGDIGMPALAGAISDAFDTDDDHLGTFDVLLSSRDLVAASRNADQQVEGIRSNLQSGLISRDGASYRLFFQIDAVRPA